MSSGTEEEAGDFDPNVSSYSDDKVDSVLIKKILYEMKSEFNRSVCTLKSEVKEEKADDPPPREDKDGGDVGSENAAPDDDGKDETPAAAVPEPVTAAPVEEEEPPHLEIKKEDAPAEDESPTDGETEKPQDETESTKTSTTEEVPEEGAGSPTPAVDEQQLPPVRVKRGVGRPRKISLLPETTLKRSARLTSGESVIQNAIAMKEKSNDLQANKPQRKRRARAKPPPDLPPSQPRPIPSSTPQDLDNAMSSVLDEFSESDTHDSSFPSSTPVKNGALENGSDSDWDKDSSSNFSVGSGKGKKRSFPLNLDGANPPPGKRAKLDSSTPLPAEVGDPAGPRRPSSVASAASSIFSFQVSWRDDCLCRVTEGVYLSKKFSKRRETCRGLDSFEDTIVGCTRALKTKAPLLRPSRLVPFLPFCESHFSRLRRHGSCPLCGVFCLQGTFMECKERHHSHVGCEMLSGEARVCPHCGTQDIYRVRLTLSAQPIFLPIQRFQPKLYGSAKMGISHSSYPEEKELSLKELLPERELLLVKKRLATTVDLPAPHDHRFSARAFYQASKNGEIEKVHGMLPGLDSNKEGLTLQAMNGAAGNGHLSTVYLLAQSGLPLDCLDKSQYTPLMLATLNRHNDVVRYLVRAGADVAFKGSDGMTALHLAAQVGNLEACQLLLSAVNRPLSFVDITDDGNWTPLVWAAENNHAQVVRYLLERKADPLIKDTEMNVALHWSAFSGSTEITELLLDYGSHINLTNVHGDSPLHIAARQGADNCVMLLLARGAKVDLRNKAGQLARDCCLAEHHYVRTAIELNAKLRGLVARGPAQATSASVASSSSRLLSLDISRGRETHPIQCLNEVDGSAFPKNFLYITENCFTSKLPIDFTISSLSGCKCEGPCSTMNCACSKASLRCWYDGQGRLLSEFNFEDPPMIFECNQTCDCNALTCHNRVVQKGIRARLQVTKTKEKNWGVEAIRQIPKGSFVCEYIGEVITDFEADTREDDSYLFDLDNREGESYCIDARKYGNVTRFINHSCRPNLVPVRVFVGHQDLHFPRIAFFAARDILPYEELGFDYGDKFWVIKYKNFTCHCGEADCRYNHKIIHETLKNFKERMLLDDSLRRLTFRCARKCMPS